MSIKPKKFLGVPDEIIVKEASRCVELVYASELEDAPSRGELSFEFLRVFSPSAEVVGHGKGQEVIQQGKREVMVDKIEPIGNYAIKITFSDGHDTGIYSWNYLSELCSNSDKLWKEYLDALSSINGSRN